MRPVKNQSDALDHPFENDPVFESLLREALQGPAPPDQRETILQQLEAGTVHRASAPAALDGPTAPARSQASGGRRRKRWLIGATVLAVAASITTAVFVARPYLQPADPAGTSIARSQPSASGTDQDPSDTSSAEKSGEDVAAMNDRQPDRRDRSLAESRSSRSDRSRTSDKGSESTRPNRPVPMRMNEVPFGQEVAVTERQPEPVVPPAMPAPPEKQSGGEIIARVDAFLAAAWDELSLPPTAAAAPEEIAERFQQTLGTSVPPEAFAAPEQLVRYVSAPQGHARLSQALVDELVGPAAASRLGGEQRRILADQVSTAFRGEASFDELVSSLFTGGEEAESFAASQVWLTALAGSQSIPLTEQTAHSLLDLDLRCGRCHNHPIESGIGQQEYWQFAAIFDNGLFYTRSDDGKPLARWKADGSNPSEGLFFELPDGRQRVALPAVPSKWLGVSEAATVDRFSELSSFWKQNPQLAKSTINRLWKIVYGRPLVAAASDPDAPPRSVQLTQLRGFLAEQLRAHDFDLAQATAWILAAEPMRLQVAPAMSHDGVLTASTEELMRADDRTRAFAAYRPQQSRQPFAELVTMATRWNGGATIDQLPNRSTLAQPIELDSNRENADVPEPDKYQEEWLRASFPTVSKITSEHPYLPAQWLSSLNSFDQQARHLFYAAGYTRPTQQQLRAAERLRQSTNDPHLALSQLWWAIQNGLQPN